jgi:hypothetical protein
MAALFGRPFESLADWATRTLAEEAAAKVVSFADYRRKLRPEEAPPETTVFTRSLMATLQNIDEVAKASRKPESP